MIPAPRPFALLIQNFRAADRPILRPCARSASTDGVPPYRRAEGLDEILSIDRATKFQPKN
jgi:hypothetical protein